MNLQPQSMMLIDGWQQSEIGTSKSYPHNYVNDYTGGIADHQNKCFRVTATTAIGTWPPVSSICDFNHQRNILSRIATGRCERMD